MTGPLIEIILQYLGLQNRQNQGLERGTQLSSRPKQKVKHNEIVIVFQSQKNLVQSDNTRKNETVRRRFIRSTKDVNSALAMVT